MIFLCGYLWNLSSKSSTFEEETLKISFNFLLYQSINYYQLIQQASTPSTRVNSFNKHQLLQQASTLSISINSFNSLTLSTRIIKSIKVSKFQKDRGKQIHYFRYTTIQTSLWIEKWKTFFTLECKENVVVSSNITQPV